MFVGTLIGAWIVAGLFLFVAPAADQPVRADAVVVLAPPLPTGRLAYAESLMSARYADTLVISVPEDSTGAAPTRLCEEDRPYRVICFTPDPVTTQGEAKAIGNLAKEHDWHRINVVTNDFHVTRARMIIERCYSRDLNMLPVRQNSSWMLWGYRFIYETAAFVKVASESGC